MLSLALQFKQVFRVGVTGKVTFEQRSEEGEGFAPAVF